MVWHGHSLNFVPDARVVFRQVSRVLRKGGLYRLSCANPYFHGIDEEEWNGDAYPLRNRYEEGEVIYSTGDEWTFRAPGRIEAPRPRPQGVQAQHGNTSELPHRTGIRLAENERRRGFWPRRRP